ncbi:hypothetical protein WDU94_010795 [Cyamophila willieti]
MDNAPYHSKKMDKVPTKSSTRKNILSWLFSQTLVPENSDLRKCELEKILEFNKLRFPPRYVYVVFSYNHAEDINNRGHHASPIYDEECKMLLDNNTEHWKCKKHRKIRSFMNKMEKTEKISLLTRVSNDPRQCIKQWVEKFPITKDEAVNLIPSLQSWLLQKTWFLRSAINGGCVTIWLGILLIIRQIRPNIFNHLKYMAIGRRGRINRLKGRARNKAYLKKAARHIRVDHIEGAQEGPPPPNFKQILNLRDGFDPQNMEHYVYMDNLYGVAVEIFDQA